MKRQIQFFFFLIIFFSFLGANAQSIQNVRASPLQDGKVTVTYDIVDAKANQKFVIELYGSHNNFSSPLTEVTGDVGKDIFGGPGRKIIWSASNELGDFKGEINFRVKGHVIVIAAAFAFKFPVEGSSIRRGKTTDLKWEGGTSGQNIKLELYKGSVKVSAIAETKNTGIYNWPVPKNLAKGDYVVKLSSGSETVNSKTFAVKPKVPLLLKALPLLAVGGVVAALGGGGGGPKPITSSDLPAAPGPN